jgi:hypothetical protein
MAVQAANDEIFFHISGCRHHRRMKGRSLRQVRPGLTYNHF